MRILVVEDDYLLATALEEALLDAGHEVVGRPNRREKP
jgi:DNA-binding response OmpR family regulator